MSRRTRLVNMIWPIFGVLYSLKADASSEKWKTVLREIARLQDERAQASKACQIDPHAVENVGSKSGVSHRLQFYRCLNLFIPGELRSRYSEMTPQALDCYFPQATHTFVRGCILVYVTRLERSPAMESREPGSRETRAALLALGALGKCRGCRVLRARVPYQA